MTCPTSATATLSSLLVEQAARRVVERCEVLAQCSERLGEITRTFCSPAMREAHCHLMQWMTDAGLAPRLDSAGNLVGRQQRGAATPGPALWIGSHLDTVVGAGRYDGVLGVMLGVALAELALEVAVPLPCPLAVIAFSEEEGVRYQTPYLGSRAVAGEWSDDLNGRCDAQGITLAEALQTFTGMADPPQRAACSPAEVLMFLEPHIEQGPVLEAVGVPVGVVTGIVGQTRGCLRWTGQAGHAGTVPMGARRDALVAAARWIVEVEQIAARHLGLVATVGALDVAPNVANVIPAEVTLRLDMRHADDAVREAAFAAIEQAAATIAGQRGLQQHWLWVERQPAVAFDERCVARLERAVGEAGWPVQRLASGAGHDSVVMSRRFPTAMLFVRCAGGISHHPDEAVLQSDVAVALEVLWRCWGKLGGEGGERVEGGP